jgi:hypothetical protein
MCQVGTVAPGKATSWLWVSDCRSCSLAWGVGMHVRWSCRCWMNELGCQLVCSRCAKIGKCDMSERTEVHHNGEVREMRGVVTLVHFVSYVHRSCFAMLIHRSSQRSRVSMPTHNMRCNIHKHAQKTCRKLVSWVPKLPFLMSNPMQTIRCIVSERASYVYAHVYVPLVSSKRQLK